MAKKLSEQEQIEDGVIEIIGAREHNLKDIHLTIPRNKLIVITGISGSGKSSLAFDTLYAEGQRRYMESFSAYARSFIGNMERPDVDKINGLSPSIETSDDIALSASTADIISTATMAHEPVLKGKWVKPGTHIDLIGAFTSDMREADDFLMSSGSIFVDSRATTIEHIGELTIPISNGIISKNDIIGDFYDLIPSSKGGRKSNDEITIFKNGGGAHLDLMIAKYLIEISNNSIS